jgi:hypothetical protein
MNARTLIPTLVTGAVILFLAGFWMAQSPPEQNKEQLQCLECHRERNLNTNEGVFSSQAFCYGCHEEENCGRDFGPQLVSLQVKREFFEGSRHQHVACIQCHTDVARSPHESALGAQCTGCHNVHGEGEAHDPHIRVRCEACHSASAFVELDKAKDQVRLAHTDANNLPISLAGHKPEDVHQEDFCGKCHHAQNKVGAAAMVLPSKSFLCLACHYAPMKVGHPLFGFAFLIGLFGMAGALMFWFKGSIQGEAASAHKKASLTSELLWDKLFSREFFKIAKIFILDVLLQRRILANSVKRWSIHSLIFYSFLGRFSLGALTLLLQNAAPGNELTLALIDKNHPFVAMTNDLLGLFIVAGVLWAIIQRCVVKPDYVATEEQDTIALGIIGVLTLSGFIVEGTRILITGIPAGIAQYSFIGYLLSGLFSLFNVDWQSIYGYLWYVHGIAVAVFVAYLPFGKLRHILTTPLSLLIRYRSR